MNPGHVYTELDDVRLHHLDYGGAGPVTILIHGVLGQAWMWAGVAPKLAAQARVVSVDLRGYGDSQWSTDGRYPTTRLADDVIRLSDECGWERVRIVGFSLGGLVGLAVADTKPELVERLVMIDLPPSSIKEPADLPPITMRARSHQEAVDAERSAVPAGESGLIESMATFGWRPGADGSLVRKHDLAMSRAWPFRSEDWWHALEGLEVPLLFVHGGVSQVCSREEAESVRDRAANGVLVEVEGAGHMIPIEQPEVLTGHLIEFLSP